MIFLSKSRLFRLRIFIILFGLAGCGDETDERADLSHIPSFDSLASFNALFTLSLKEARQGSAIAGYSGLMTMTWAKECDGFRSEQRIAAHLSNLDGDVILSEFTASTWEDFDQTVFRFYQNSLTNRRPIQKIAGRAERAAWGQVGRIQLSQPEEVEKTLDADVLFPTMYTALLVRQAQLGKDHFRAFLYDGSDEHAKYDTVAVIGDRSVYDDEEDVEFEALSGLLSWPVHISYYEVGNVEGVPDFQISMRLFENGFSSDLVLDYGSFALNGELTELRAIDDPDCGNSN